MTRADTAADAAAGDEDGGRDGVDAADGRADAAAGDGAVTSQAPGDDPTGAADDAADAAAGDHERAGDDAARADEDAAAGDDAARADRDAAMGDDAARVDRDAAVGDDAARADEAAEAAGRAAARGAHRFGVEGVGAGPPPGAAGRTLSGAEAREVVRERGRRTLARSQLGRRHARLQVVSPRVGELDERAFHDLLGEDADAAVALLADLAAATDAQLRAQARRLAARLFVRAGRLGEHPTKGYRRLAPSRAAGEGDLDLDLTFEVAGGKPRHADDLVARRWVAPKRALCLLVDHSGSMEGHAVGLAAMATAAVVLNQSDRATTSVIAFAKDALVLQDQTETRAPAALVDDLLSLRGKGRTDLALALRAAAAQLAREPAAERHAILLSDCRATAGSDPLRALAGLDRVDVLGTSADPEAVASGRELASRARGCYRSATNYVRLQDGLLTLLS